MLKTISLAILSIFNLISGLTIYDDEIFYKIPNINSPQQVLWRDTENIVIVDDANIYSFNLKYRILEEIGTREPNELVGLDSNLDLIYCSFKNFLIYSYDEFSTKFQILDKNKEVVKEFEYFETIRPIFLLGDILIATTSYPFLEEHFYLIHISTGIRDEIPVPNYIKLSFNSF